MRTRPALLTLLVVLALAAVAGTTGAANGDEYRISIGGHLDVPDRTVTFDGTEYNITEIKAIDPGESFTAEFDVPSESMEYSIQFRDINEDLYDAARLTGDGQETFDTSELNFGQPLDPGTYFVALKYDGSFRTLYPVIVEGYDVSAAVPDTAVEGSTITVNATVTEKPENGQTLSGVNMVIGNDTVSRTVNLSSSAGNVSTTISLGDLPPGNYSVYVAARGTETVSGERVPIGLSNAHAFNVTAAPTTCVADVVSGDDGTIGLTEIQEAINWWAEGTEVPGTGGETISLTGIQSLINAWAEGTTVSCSG